MGTWGISALESDLSLDWIYAWLVDPSTKTLQEALKKVGHERYIDLQTCYEALAAAEIVAARFGNTSPALPSMVMITLVGINEKIDGTLRKLALRAVSTIIRESELRELMQESGELDNWLGSMKELSKRLTVIRENTNEPKQVLKKAARGRRETLKIGDLFDFSLMDGRKMHAQYIHFSKRYGYLVRIFEQMIDRCISAEPLRSMEQLFSPVFINLDQAVKDRHWKRSGNLPVENFVFPLFRHTNGTKEGAYHDWRIWNGTNLEFIGDLPPEYSGLEFLCIWGYDVLEERIRTGINRFDTLK